ncbi:MAG: hypothetical protein RLZZ224_1687, partial [Verrucomicrobiota bacterium]
MMATREPALNAWTAERIALASADMEIVVTIPHDALPSTMRSVLA